MSEQQTTTPERGVSPELLKKASTIPAGVNNLEDFDPMEDIPTIAVGQEITEGMTIAGWFEKTERISSPKFIHSKETDENGVKVQYRHVLRVGSPTGDRLAIWNCGELKVIFAKTLPGEFVSITYKGKGKNAKNQDQHFFDVKKQAPTPHQQ